MKSTIKIGNNDIILEGNAEEIWQILLKFQNSHSIDSNNKSDNDNIKPNVTRFPTTTDMVEFIEGRPDFQHSMGEVQQHFLDRKLNLKDSSDINLYYKLNRRLNSAKNKIQKAYHGNWVEDTLHLTTIGRSHFTTYKFVKE